MARLAELPTLWVKMSGLPAYCGHLGATVAKIQPYTDAVLELFGPSRILWGGDWPVVKLGNGLSDWISMTRALLLPLSKDEQVFITSGNCRAFYIGK